MVEDTRDKVPLFLVPSDSRGKRSNDAQMNKKLQEILTSKIICPANNTFEDRSGQDPFLKIVLLFRPECPARECSDDEVGHFVEEDLRLFYHNVSQTISIVIMDDSYSEVEELQEMRHLVTHNTVFGCHILALLKTEDTTLQVLQFQAEQEVNDGIFNGELIATADETVNLRANYLEIFIALGDVIDCKHHLVLAGVSILD